MMVYKLYKLTFFLLIILLIKVDLKEVRNLTDINFDLEVKNGIKNPWYVMFYLETCQVCKITKSDLDSLINEFEQENSLNAGVVECAKNIWTCLRFNITKVPTILYIDQNSMFEFTNNTPTKDSLYTFHKEEKLMENRLRIPHALGYVGLVGKIAGEAVVMFNSYLNGVIISHGYDFNWTTIHSIFFFAILIIVLVVLEYYFITICCRNKNKNKSKYAKKHD